MQSAVYTLHLKKKKTDNNNNDNIIYLSKVSHLRLKALNNTNIAEHVIYNVHRDRDCY